MQGIGNDFVVLDGINQSINFSAEQYRQIADRHFGIGCDQILLVEAAEDDSVDFKYRIFNANGNEVEQCGNGARCFARFVKEKKLSNKPIIRVATKNNVIVLEIDSKNLVTVNMGTPKFNPLDIPFNAPEVSNRYQLLVDGESIEIGAVSMGNPHGVLLVGDLQTAPVLSLGAKLECHKSFPAHANIGFMQIMSRKAIKLRVFERGSGETLACGSGACAAVVVGQRWGLLDQEVQVQLPGGDLLIRRQSEDAEVLMSGPAEFVFEGEISLTDC